VISARSDAAGVSLKIIAEGVHLGLRAAGAETEEILRIEAGLPASGHELSDRFNPLEAELRHAISFTKGCYTGQEVVARLNTYDKVQRALRGLALTGGLVPPPGSRVLDAGKEVGRVTSAVHSPARGAPLVLAYLEIEHGEPGTRLGIEVESQATATMVEAEAEVLAPPFVS
jgi:folate-binding protein YgfZ